MMSAVVLFMIKAALIPLISGRKLVWSDEFNGSGVPDPSKWSFDVGGSGGGNFELQYYTSSTQNAQQQNGNLVITARKENPNSYHCWYGTCTYTSASLTTKGHFVKKYGYIEARIKPVCGAGYWPAFWLLGNNAGPWPQCGEIDIMEMKGSRPNTLQFTIHGPEYAGGSGVTVLYDSPNGQPYCNDFHVFGLQWSANSITFYIDGHKVITRTPSSVNGHQWVFNHDFYMILNLAIGGGYPGNPNDSTVFPQSMLVDYIRVYDRM